MTVTKKFTQSKKVYFQIVLYTAFRKRWWMYTFFLLMGLVHLYFYLKSGDLGNLVWCIAGFGYLLFLYIYLYRFAHAKDKDDFLSEKQLFFDKDRIRLEESVGGFGEIPIERIKKVIEKDTFWMLYISKNQFIYVPKDIFYKDDDFEDFKKLIDRV